MSDTIVRPIRSTAHLPLRDLAADRGLPIGTAVALAPLAEDERYAQTLRREFNMIVAENAFKQAEVWKAPYAYDFTQTDRLAAFARANGMLLRGHTLVWHQQTPSWLLPDAFSSSELREMLQAYIHAFVSRYRGAIDSWDVVNEAVEEDGSLRTESIWYRTLGPDYIEDAFRWAHEADPTASLYYNDYEAEDMGSKSNGIYSLLRHLRGRGVAVHGIGFQYHLENGWRARAAHAANIRRFHALGLDWQVTECDIRLPLNGAPPTDAALAAQAAAYGDLTRLCLDEPGCRGLVTWGFTDAHSWIPGFREGWGASLPFDEHYRPKPACAAIRAALLG